MRLINPELLRLKRNLTHKSLPMDFSLPLMILVSGPYRSGTGDDPKKISANLRRMEKVALQLYQKGHIPILGEWHALPLLKHAGSTLVGDEVFTEYFHPVAMRLLEKCDAVLRIEGPSAGADEMIRTAQEFGKIVFLHPSDVPEAYALLC
jgi:GDP-mannose pyrophosphatase NudK